MGKGNDPNCAADAPPMAELLWKPGTNGRAEALQEEMERVAAGGALPTPHPDSPLGQMSDDPPHMSRRDAERRRLASRHEIFID
jgi:hypothetical protein